jgi:hypothetical protein
MKLPTLQVLLAIVCVLFMTNGANKTWTSSEFVFISTRLISDMGDTGFFTLSGPLDHFNLYFSVKLCCLRKIADYWSGTALSRIELSNLFYT